MKPNRPFLVIAYVVFLAALVEGACYLGLLALAATKGLTYEPVFSAPLDDKTIKALERIAIPQGQYIVFDQELGWTLAPSASSDDGQYTTTPLGSRTTARDPTTQGDAALRVAAYGDSYVHGDEVADSETWAFVLERAYPSWSLINYGVRGYGPDQAYLRYLRTRGDPRVNLVVIGYMSENLQRVTNVFRPFYFSDTEFPFSKPRYKLVENRLVLVPNPLSLKDYRRLLDSPDSVLQKLGSDDWYYNNLPHKSKFDFLATVRLVRLYWSQLHREKMILSNGLYNTRSEAYRLALKILQQFAAEVARNQQTPIVVIFPSHDDLERIIDGRAVRYSPLVEDLVSGGVCVVDLKGAFAEVKTKKALSEVFRRQHYSPHGNELVASFLGPRLLQISRDHDCPK